MTQLISRNYSGDLVEAVQKSLPFLKGHFAFALIHKDHPNLIVASACECPRSIRTAIGRDRIESPLPTPNAFLKAIAQCGLPSQRRDR